jgi:hypothetical protein
MAMSSDSHPAQARDQDRKLSIAFLTFLALKMSCPVFSSMTDSITEEGSELGANSAKLANSTARAARYAFLDILAPLGREISNSKHDVNVPGVRFVVLRVAA